MNKQHQLWGGWPFCPTPWHRFHTKSQQIEVDMPEVKTLVLTMLPLYIHRAVVRRGERKWREGEGCVNKKSRIMGQGLFYREQNGSIWALRLSKLASVRYKRFIQGDTWSRCLQWYDLGERMGRIKAVLKNLIMLKIMPFHTSLFLFNLYKKERIFCTLSAAEIYLQSKWKWPG